MIGKVAKLHSSAVAIEQGYTEAIGIGDVDKIDKLYWRCHCGGPYEISFMFVDEQPFRRLVESYFIAYKRSGTVYLVIGIGLVWSS